MKVILYMAISLNGIIARENNEEDFLSDENWQILLELSRRSGCMIWGRKTYEIVKTWDKRYIDSLSDIKKIIVSANSDYDIEEGFELINSPKGALDKLGKDGFKEVVLTGGSTLNSSFAKENLIDEILLNVEPVIIGKGIPLFFPEEFDLKLEFVGMKRISESLIQLTYKVIK